MHAHTETDTETHTQTDMCACKIQFTSLYGCCLSLSVCVLYAPGCEPARRHQVAPTLTRSPHSNIAHVRWFIHDPLHPPFLARGLVAGAAAHVKVPVDEGVYGGVGHGEDEQGRLHARVHQLGARPVDEVPAGRGGRGWSGDWCVGSSTIYPSVHRLDRNVVFMLLFKVKG